MKSKKLPDYLFVGRAQDLKNKSDRKLYRRFEMLPGLLVWGTFAIVILLSWLKPVWMSIIIIAFAFFWLLKSVYLAIHTRSAYKIMLRHEKINWIDKLKKLPKEDYRANVDNWQNIWHLIVIPMYNESFEVVGQSFEALASSDWPKDKMIVVLSAEELGGEKAQKTMRKIERKYKDEFFSVITTTHPAGLKGEMAGKGSNETWAAKKAGEIIDANNIPHDAILVSALDSDTVVYPRYFSCISYHFLTAEKPYRSSYQPIPLFINNIWQAPALSRISAFSSTFWHTLSQERPEKQTTFSSHSMTYKALLDVGYWQTNVVSEDSRIFFQCFLRYSGDYSVVSLYYPIAMDANVAPSYTKTLKNIYKQMRRWAYGSENIPYLLFGYTKDKSIPFMKFFRHAFNKIEGFHSWATHALLLFIMGWLPIFLGGDEFNVTSTAYNLLPMVRWLLTAAMIGLVSSAYLSILLLPPRPPNYGKHKYIVMVAQWLLIPFTLIIFGAFPAIEAQTRLMLGKYMGFWVTPKHRKE
ncbi:MAG: glycosyltransferase family 2 protein [Candidatus Spechtbacterales bacterium]|nr:glycosyltransferase family 2 protein [Candidatus Spechtbacterales bacterium]